MKGVEYRLVHVLPGNQRIHLRLAGFRGGTVPALRLDGRKIQGSIGIAHELEAIAPDPPLYPADPQARARVDDIERWGADKFQDVPRRIFRWAMTKDAGLRRWLAELDGKLPAPGIASRVTGPVSVYYARAAHADREQVRRDIAELPTHLDRVDALFEQQILTSDPLNAATIQVMCTVRALLGFSDFADRVAAHSYAPLAHELFPYYPEALVPPFVERLGAA